MRKVLSDLQGGFPLTLDELETIQGNVKDIDSGLAKGFSISDTNIPVIVSGINAVVNNPGSPTPTVNISTGYFWYIDEVYMFDAVSALALPAGYTQQDFEDNYFFDLSITTDTSVLFKDGLTKDVNESRKTILTTTPATWVGLSYSSIETFQERISDTFPQASETELGKIQLASSAETITGTNTLKAVTPDTLTDALDNRMGTVYTRTVPLPVWDMTIVSGVPVSNITGNLTKIVGVNVTIFDDAGTNAYEIVGGSGGGSAQGYIRINDSTINIFRETGGFFDDAAFSALPTSRGWVTYSYIL